MLEDIYTIRSGKKSTVVETIDGQQQHYSNSRLHELANILNLSFEDTAYLCMLVYQAEIDQAASKVRVHHMSESDIVDAFKPLFRRLSSFEVFSILSESNAYSILNPRLIGEELGII